MALVETTRFTPPGLVHPEKPLGPISFLRTLVRNPMETWPTGFFTEKTVDLVMLGRKVVFVMDPAMVEEILVAQADKFPKAPIIQRTIGAAVG
ncbi:MAG: hypothetical protein WCH83_17455, partial [Alphaproteobacteria bacterium]